LHFAPRCRTVTFSFLSHFAVALAGGGDLFSEMPQGEVITGGMRPRLRASRASPFPCQGKVLADLTARPTGDARILAVENGKLVAGMCRRNCCAEYRRPRRESIAIKYLADGAEVKSYLAQSPKLPDF
jgi:hypothetical protein